jgi:hypothetical protein
MRATIKRCHSPDIDDLRTFAPTGRDFGFLLQILVGPLDHDGEETFDIVVCTAGWLAQRLTDSPLSGRGYLFVRSYDFPTIEAYLRRHVEAASGTTWEEIASKLSRLAHWEFDDYPEPEA